MGYLQEVDTWLEGVLEKFIGEMQEAESEETAEELFSATKQEIKEKILESYHNGQKGVGGSEKKAAGGWRKKFSKFRKSE